MRDVQEAARALGLQITVLNASSERDIETAFATLVQQRAGALLVAADAFLFSRRDQDRHAGGPPRGARDIPMARIRRRRRPDELRNQSCRMYIAMRASYVGRILKGESPPTCRSCNPRRSNW